jgi:cytochrome b subunit of formate dehydrogenase
VSDSRQPESPAPPAPQGGATAEEAVSPGGAVSAGEPGSRDGAVLTDEGVSRFSVTERLSHWFYALFFLVAFISGLLMWLPVTRAWLAGARQTFSHFHGGMGFLMVAIPLILFLLFDRRRLAADLREVDRWDGDDRRWFWAAVRGGTLRGADMPPQRRLNAGQKVNAVLVAAMAVGFVVTGSLLLARVHLPAWLVSRALWLHGFLAVTGIALFLGHLAHVFLTSHGRDYLRGMIYGRLRLETALARHGKWSVLRMEPESPPQAALPLELGPPSGDQAGADQLSGLRGQGADRLPGP